MVKMACQQIENLAPQVNIIKFRTSKSEYLNQIFIVTVSNEN